jgi:MFS family permease
LVLRSSSISSQGSSAITQIVALDGADLCYGVILSVDTALTSDLVPLEEAGKYMAYANLAVGVANGIAPPIFGFILNFHRVPTLGNFIAFFIVSAAFFITSSIVMVLKVPNT